MKFIQTILMMFLSACICSCSSSKNQSKHQIVYQSETLIITKISPNVYQHTSFLQTESFGNVPCNGMIVQNNSEAVVFDTPVNDEISEELILWIQQDLKSNIKAVIPTHFHDDCLGGLNQFHKHHIPSVAFFKTIEIAKEKQLPVPQEHFDKSLEMTVGNERVLIDFFGEGHTKDNIVGYFPSEKILFGGCLIKELNAGKGNLEDANEKDWAQTVKNLKAAYPEIKTIIPGHGTLGDNSLLDYTITLFSK